MMELGQKSPKHIRAWGFLYLRIQQERDKGALRNEGIGSFVQLCFF